jgi:hypothetical protein
MPVPDLHLTTEDIEPERVLDYLVRTPTDAELLGHLKSRSPVLLRGSRGSGKSLLLRSAQREMLDHMPVDHLLPVYASFMNTPLIKVRGPEQFLPWMIATLANSIVRAAQDQGLSIPSTAALNAIGADAQPGGRPSRLKQIQDRFENAWRQPKGVRGNNEVPDATVLVEAVRDLCRDTGLKRIVLLIDEAAQVFVPDQQRQFFTLMRDLRSPYLTVKAAIYPGVTSFGYAFQPGHDATVVSLDRDVTDKNYLNSMREIISRQDKRLAKTLSEQGHLLDILALAATGNPRIFLTMLSAAGSLRQTTCEQVLRKYYREDIWQKHNDLADRYPGHQSMIGWGATFMHDHVFPALWERYHRESVPGGLRDIWIHRDAPQAAQEAMQFLCYSGVLQQAPGPPVKLHNALGIRYVVNLGCQFVQAKEIIKYAEDVRRDLSRRNVIEFGREHEAYRSLPAISETAARRGNTVLDARLRTPSSELVLTKFQRTVIIGLKLGTVGDVLRADESTFKKAKGVGDVRARRIHNAVQAAVMEYLSG